MTLRPAKEFQTTTWKCKHCDLATDCNLFAKPTKNAVRRHGAAAHPKCPKSHFNLGLVNGKVVEVVDIRAAQTGQIGMIGAIKRLIGAIRSTV